MTDGYLALTVNVHCKGCGETAHSIEEECWGTHGTSRGWVDGWWEAPTGWTMVNHDLFCPTCSSKEI